MIPTIQRNDGFTLSIQIDASVDTVYTFLANGLNMPLWYEAVQDIQELPSDSGRTLGRFRITRNLPGGPASNDVELVGEPGPALTVRSLNGPTPFTYRYDLKPSPAGTHLTLAGSITAAGLTGIAALAAPFAQHLFRAGMAKNLVTLKRLVERNLNGRLPTFVQ